MTISRAGYLAEGVFDRYILRVCANSNGRLSRGELNRVIAMFDIFDICFDYEFVVCISYYSLGVCMYFWLMYVFLGYVFLVYVCIFGACVALNITLSVVT